jgi:YesN/AraC family two-component response regulator
MSVETYLKFAVSVGISSTCPSIEEISQAYSEAKEALRYRLVKDGNTTISFHDVMPYTGDIQYPLQEEQNIIHDLCKGNKDEVMEGLTKFVQIVNGNGYSTPMIYQSFFMLYTALFRISEEISSRLASMNALDSITSCQTISEVEGWFRLKLFPVLFDAIDSELEQSGMQLVGTVKAYIAEHYREDLSLTAMADHVGLNPSYFSRLFVKSSGVNFLNYVSMVKIDRAKALLVETDSNISEIAEQIGYTVPTFRRVFKQRTGMTPIDYRSSQHNGL